jgi:chromosome segregation ATPase
MPLGLWKSKWEIHREDVDRYREEARRFREEMREVREETRDLRADYDHEVAESRLFNRELLIRLEKTYENLGTTLKHMGEQIDANTEEVRAQTQAILKLVDRFEDTNGRPPV